jgi:beta-phosphoglucomutase-like phosphatase (HAD superfamily)
MIDDMPAGWNAAHAAKVRALAYVGNGGLERAVGNVTGFTDMAQVPGLIGLA